MSTEVDSEDTSQFRPYCDDTGESLLHLSVQIEVVKDESDAS